MEARNITKCNFKEIKTFEDACKILGMNFDKTFKLSQEIAQISKASAAMFKVNIIRKALNLGQDLHFTKNPKGSEVWYPYVPLIKNECTLYDDEIKHNEIKVIGEIKNEGVEYRVLGGIGDTGGCNGLGGFSSDNLVGCAYACVGFLGCASEEIARHFGKYFGMLITEAKYGDIVDFEIINIFAPYAPNVVEN